MLRSNAVVRTTKSSASFQAVPYFSLRQYGQRKLHASTSNSAQISTDVANKAEGRPPPSLEARKSIDASKKSSQAGEALSSDRNRSFEAPHSESETSPGTTIHRASPSGAKNANAQERALAEVKEAADKSKAKGIVSDLKPAERPPIPRPAVIIFKDTLGRKSKRSSKKVIHPSRKLRETAESQVRFQRTSAKNAAKEEPKKQNQSLYDILTSTIVSRLGFGNKKREAKPSTPVIPALEENNANAAREISRLAAAASTKTERMEIQSRLVLNAIKDARERGCSNEKDAFFLPRPQGSSPKTMQGKEGVWLDLGPDPQAWGSKIPAVKDRWHEVLALDLTKEIVVSQRPFAKRLGNVDGMSAEEQEEAFGDLIDDYDLEDHERLEQLGDSIVNMSSRLLAYQSYPDINEGALTRLSNYPTQNNFLALLFQECGLAERRNELRSELQGNNSKHGFRQYSNRDKHAKKGGARAHNGVLSENEMGRNSYLTKRNADMFEAYVAAVFLSNGSDFQVVHEWLCHLFRPFHDQAYRFMAQRSETLALLHASQQKDQNGSVTERIKPPASADAPALSIPGFIDSSPDSWSTFTDMARIYPNFASSKIKQNADGVPLFPLNTSEPFITDDFLTVAARARRNREEQLREQVRLQDQEELMNMGLFRKGFLNLRKGFRQYLMGRDVVLEEEENTRQRIEEGKALFRRDMREFSNKYRTTSDFTGRSRKDKRKNRQSTAPTASHE